MAEQLLKDCRRCQHMDMFASASYGRMIVRCNKRMFLNQEVDYSMLSIFCMLAINCPLYAIQEHLLQE